MSIAKQLFQLQEIDLEIESKERTLNQLVSQLGESQAVTEAQGKLAAVRQHREELDKQQRAAEWEIADLTEKLKAADSKLYGGNVRNPKELSGIQQETNTLKASRRQLEDKVLELMEHIEQAGRDIASSEIGLKKLETEWQSQQAQLNSQVEELKLKLSTLREKRQLLAADLAAQVMQLYQELRKQKSIAVAKVGQGICSGCRVSLPVVDIQRARGGHLIQCSSCRRILYLA